MKKILSALICVLLLFAAAAAETPTVTVSITDSQGNIVMACKPVELLDTDGDNALTIHDALYNAHEVYYEGGAASGYLSEDQGYGLSLCVLWGEDNSISYGYCVNDTSALSLLDPVTDNDHIKVYAYTDLETWSDTYCYFQTTTAEVAAGSSMDFTLTALIYDSNWNVVATPVEGAVITINGADTAFVTNAEGIASVTFPEAGEYLISARSETMTLVPPVCMASVS